MAVLAKLAKTITRAVKGANKVASAPGHVTGHFATNSKTGVKSWVRDYTRRVDLSKKVAETATRKIDAARAGNGGAKAVNKIVRDMHSKLYEAGMPKSAKQVRNGFRTAGVDTKSFSYQRTSRGTQMRISKAAISKVEQPKIAAALKGVDVSGYAHGPHIYLERGAKRR